MLVRALHLAIIWRDGGQVLVNGVTGAIYRASPTLIRVLDLAGQPFEESELVARAGVDHELVASLVDAGLLVEAGGGDRDGWSTFELIVQRMAGGGGRRSNLVSAEMPCFRKEPSDRPGISVPRGSRGASARLASVLRHRRSHREFRTGELEFARLGEFLNRAAAVERSVPAAGVSYRPHPSAGGRHPLEVYLAPLHVDGLRRAVYRFDPFERLLFEVEAEGDRIDKLPAEMGRALDSQLPVEPAAVLLITAVFARTLWKYEGIGLGLIYKDAGALLQTFYLMAGALGLAGCAVQLRGEADVAGWLGLDPVEESLVACFALGLPA
jgi:SagB-type dehydrogenase family enzyme